MNTLDMFKYHYQKYIIGCLVLVITFGCEEDTIQPQLFGSLFGEVLLENTSTSVEGVTISTNPPTSSVSTDPLGRFGFEDIEVGTYSIRAEKTGFLTEIESVTVFEGKVANVIFRLRPDSTRNEPPALPNSPFPPDGAVNQPVNLSLQWTSSDANAGDILKYSATLFDDQQTNGNLIIENSTSAEAALSNLAYNRVYRWQVQVNDGKSTVTGPVWSFKTQPFPLHRIWFAKADEAGKYDIFSSFETGDPIQLTTGGVNHWRPRVNPGRTQVAYIANNGIQPQLYVMDRDGSNVRKVTNIPIDGTNLLDLDFSWSPDGTRLLYMNNNRLYTILTDGSGLQQLTDAPTGSTFTEVDWAGPSNLIAVRVTGKLPYNSQIFLLNDKGEQLRQVIPDLPGSTGGPAFSITGQYLLYTQDVSGFESADGRQLDSRIFLYDLRTDAAIDLSKEGKIAGTNDLDARFSPDGARIIFVNTNNDGISPRNIYVMDLDGKNRRLLFENAEMPEWK